MSLNALRFPEGITPELFLKDYWQQKPLLMRQAIPDYICPVDANELAGLAMEEAVESRIILENHNGQHWQPLTGPFEEEDFQALPDTHWTLLVQQLDAWDADINALKALFNFIPFWRFDDIMASYAPEGGSVGPHYDQYDVFLFQASGQRHWRIGQHCDATSPRLSDTPLRILQEFEESENWVLGPGDILYLPPNLAHYGIGLDSETGGGECITLSIGYKAPTHAQIVSHFSDYLLESIDPFAIFEDKERLLQTHASEICKADLDQARKILLQQLSKTKEFAAWFGEYMSAPKNEQTLSPAEATITQEELISALDEGAMLFHNEGSNFLFINLHENEADSKQGLSLFVDGTHYPLAPKQIEFVKWLCETSQFGLSDLSQRTEITTISELLESLVNQGSLVLD